MKDLNTIILDNNEAHNKEHDNATQKEQLKQSTYSLYIGSNNTTHKVEKTLIIEMFSLYFEGFTIQNALGYWQGKPEETVVVTINTTKRGMTRMVERLKRELYQDAIAVVEHKEMQFL